MSNFWHAEQVFLSELQMVFFGQFSLADKARVLLPL